MTFQSSITIPSNIPVSFLNLSLPKGAEHLLQLLNDREVLKKNWVRHILNSQIKCLEIPKHEKKKDILYVCFGNYKLSCSHSIPN